MLQAVACCINTQLRTSNHAEVYPIEHSDFDACNCVANAVLQFLYRVQIWFVYRTFQVSLDKIAPSPPRGGGIFYIWIYESNPHNTGTSGHQPRSYSHQNDYVTSGIPQHGDSTTAD